MAEQFFLDTRTDIDVRLVQGAAAAQEAAEQIAFFSQQQTVEKAEEEGDKEDIKMELAGNPDEKISLNID